jgi:replication factor C large subunit
MNESWIRKYRPKSVKEIVGQKLEADIVVNFVRNFPRTRKKALLLHGPEGAGKTAIVKALANDLNLELIELNASDHRNADAIMSILMPAVKQISLFGQRKLILIDEIDGLSGHQDRGGASSVVDVIKETNFPIILTANDAYSEKLKTLRTYCELVEFKPLSSMAVLERLKEICAKEGIKYELPALQKLATSTNGDLRAATNDLQMLSDKDKDLTLAEIKLWGREKEESIFTLLRMVFKTYDSETMLKVSDYVDEDIDRLILWLEQNIPAEYQKTSELAFAYNRLADAGIFLSRIQRRQHWRFLIYARYLALVGVQQAKLEVNRRFVMHQRPELLLKFFIRAAKRSKMKGIAEQLADVMHTSGQRLQTTFWPYYSAVTERGKNFAIGLDL